MSSSETEDENIQKLLEAVDTDFLSNKYLSNSGSKLATDTDKRNSSGDLETSKSNRYITQECPFQSDIIVQESMKKHFCKKMSSIIEQQICYDDSNIHDTSKRKLTHAGVKLFKDSQNYLKLPQTSGTHTKRKKFIPIVNDVDCKEKVNMSVVDADYIIKQSKIGNPRIRRSSLVFEYKWEQSRFVLQYPQNEFAQRRKKNEWDESKISRFRQRKT
ncbi:uncharacterized protein LOC129727922 [Wyeomyia smithii]|uniref:uncharacterized protein LOC129727922 n=1 Tax=Wyeomyia smithii TaxID=174621 RepID=UPI0024680900|nr:uncharacterized protein LOC129727922 [Wyeomyia smithii]